MGKASCIRNQSALSCLRCPVIRTSPKGRSDLRSLRQRWNMGRTKTERLIISVNAAFGIMRRPACRVFEQTNCADAAVGAEIEPVQEASRHSDQISRYDLNGDDRAVMRVNVKQP